MTKQIKVLQIVHSLGMGGAETWLVRMARYWALLDKSVKIEILVTSGQKNIFDDEVIQLGIPIHYITLNKQHVFNFIHEFRNLLKKNQYDAIHDHQDFLSGWHFLFGMGFLPQNRVAHVHNPSYQVLENYGVNFSRRLKIQIGTYLLQRFSTHIGGTSKQILEECNINKNNFPNQWLGALHCAFDINDWAGSHSFYKSALCRLYKFSENVKIILFVGRFDISLDTKHLKNHKNSSLALQIFHKIKEKYNGELKFIMIGENEYILNEFIDLVRRLKIENDVFLLGIKRQIKEYMLGCDLLLFPSRSEGLGMVAVEAQAAGLPVLASDGVPQECVVDQNMVSFCKLEDDLDTWATAATRILSNGRNDSTEKSVIWKNSEFNIEISSHNLKKIYSALPPLD